MATSEPLVPQGLPQGDRQKIEAAMEFGGVPKQVPAGGGAPSIPPSPPTGRAPAPPAPAPDLSGWDVLAGREPTMQGPPGSAPDPVSMFQFKLDSSPNTAMQYYFGRWQEFLE